MRIIPGAVVGLCLFSPVAHSQRDNKPSSPFRKFVTSLPPVNKVEIIAVTPFVTDKVEKVDCAQPGFVCAPDTFPYKIGAVERLVGEDAQRVAAMWRKLERDFLFNDQKCLVPDHLVRFFQDDSLVLESQVSTFGRKLTLPAMGVVSVAGSNDAPYDRFQDLLIPDSSRDQDFENFRREMIPKIGQQLTITGLLLTDLKGGLAVAYGDGAVYLRGVDIARMNKLFNLGCHTGVRVTGALRHYAPPPPRKEPVTSQRPPEHFYFEGSGIEVLRVENPGRPKRRRR